MMHGMHGKSIGLAMMVLAVAATACGDDGATDSGTPGLDSGSGGDSGPRLDSGPGPEDAGDAGPDADSAMPPPPPGPGCAVLPASGGTVVRIGPGQAAMLRDLSRSAPSGTTILLEGGTYRISGSSPALRFQTPNVTLRSVSNDASAVIFDGDYGPGELISIEADDVTLAHFTIMRAADHLVHVHPSGSGADVTGTRIYGMRFIDSGEQFIKINTGGGRAFFVDDGAVECSFFQLTDAGRPHIERNPGGCYTGGIDAHSARGWVVRNNEFRDIYCEGEGLAEHAVHFWSGSRDTLVENNTILNCARGIGFGLIENGVSRDYADDPYPGAGYIGHYDGLIRNNVIFGDVEWYDTGVELNQARGARVYHNTVWSTAAATGWYKSIDYRFPNTDVDIRNNLVRQIGTRAGATGRVENNAEGVVGSTFVDVGGRDFHLAAGASVAIDQGATLGAAAGVDMDGDAHDAGSAPDLGADERP